MKKTINLILVSMLIITIIFVFYPPNSWCVTASEINVPGDHSTIQAAINAASSGDTIVVSSGTYYENLEIDIDLTLTGSDKDTTIIDGSSNDHVIDVVGIRDRELEFHISGFTIQNAGGGGKDCIAISFADSGTINGNNIKSSSQGDGIQLDHCTGLTISNNVIENNENGAGVSLTLSESNNIYGNTIQSNDKGLYLYYNSNNNEFYSNMIYNNNYGIHIAQSIQSSGNYFYQNDIKNNVQSAEDPHTNYWSKNSNGNYWSDYSGSDANGDGIGDIPYTVAGDGENQDAYPLGYFASGSQLPNAIIQSISPNPSTEGQTVSFNGYGTDDGSIIAYEWKVDGITVSSNEDFSSSGFSVGTHSVSFRVKDNDNQWSQPPTTDTFTIIKSSQQNNPPTATIIYPQISETATYGEPVRFYGIGQDQDIDDILSYSWTSSIIDYISGDDSFYKSDLPVGEHTITFRVTDNHGAYAEASRTLIISSDPNIDNNIPIAVIEGPSTGIINNSVSFDGSNSYDPDEDDSITDYSWNFGDGAKGSGETVEHTYSNTGEYLVQLTVTDNHGEQNIDVITITIKDESSNQGSTGNDKWVIPGFEVIFVIIAIGVIFFFISKKRK